MKYILTLIFLFFMAGYSFCQLYTMNPKELEHGQAKILKKVTKIAEKGDTAAMYLLGQLYYEKNSNNFWHLSADDKKALYWFLRGDALGCVQCSFGAGMVYKGGPSWVYSPDTAFYNRDSALYFINKAALAGYAPAIFVSAYAWLGPDHYDLEKATIILQSAAAMNYLPAIRQLQEWQYASDDPTGKGDAAFGNADYDHANWFWTIAANYNHDSLAMYKLYLLGMSSYRYGRVYGDYEWFETNTDKSPIEWVWKSADGGYVEGMYAAGKMEEMYNNRTRAIQFYKDAIRHGYEPAANRLAALENNIKDEQQADLDYYLNSLNSHNSSTGQRTKTCPDCGGKGFTNDHVTYYDNRSDGKGGTKYGDGGVKTCGRCNGKGYIIY